MGGVGAWAEVGTCGGKAGIAERGESNFGDRRIGIACRESEDDPLLPEIARLPRAVGDEFGEELRHEDCVVGDSASAPICDRNGSGIACATARITWIVELHAADDRPRGSV